VQEFFDAEIKKLKLKPYYFPLFVTENVLQKEKDHIEGFAPEVRLFLYFFSDCYSILQVNILV
jgi:prolyl-tRNA synthetase